MLDEAVKKVFEEAQNGIQTHEKLMKTLCSVFKQKSNERFFDDFTKLLKRNLLVGEKNPYVDRTLDFVAKFVSTLDQQRDEEDTEARDGLNSLLNKLFSFLLQIHDVASAAVRLRVCQLLSKLLDHMDAEASLDDSLYEHLLHAMLQRIRDKMPAIRSQAVIALARLQDPTNKNCPVIKAYLFHMGYDPHFEVRKEIVQNIGASAVTLQPVLERTRDVKDSVRKAAIVFLAERVHIKSLTIAQRVRLIEEGLQDRSDLVKKACQSILLPAWVKQSGDQVSNLLNFLDVENSNEAATLTLNVLIPKVSANELVQSIDFLGESNEPVGDKLTCEKVFWWRSVSQHLRSLDDDDWEEKILPSLPLLCAFIKRYVEEGKELTPEENMEREFICQQLLQLTQVYDLADEMGRQELLKLLRHLLLSPQCRTTLVPSVVDRLSSVLSDSGAIVQQLVEITSELQEPLNTQAAVQPSDEEVRSAQLQLAKVRVEINQLQDELERSVQKQDFMEAASIKNKIVDLEARREELLRTRRGEGMEEEEEEEELPQDDSQAVVKSLVILCEMLKNPALKKITPTIQAVVDTQLLPAVLSVDPPARKLGVEALGMACVLSKDLSKQHMLLLIQISQVDQPTIRVGAIKSIVDILLTFGIQEMCSIEESVDDHMDDNNATMQEDTPAPSAGIISILTSLLDSEISEIRLTVAEGMCKLLMLGRIVSPRLVSRLVLLWYNPVSEDDVLLRQMLGVFFPAYASISRMNQLYMEEAFLPTLKVVFRAPGSSPMSEVDADDIARFFIHLMHPSILRDAAKQDGAALETNIHANLAVKICNEILITTRVHSLRSLVRALSQLDLSAAEEPTLRDLLTLSEKILEEINETITHRAAVRFQLSINKLLTARDDDKVFKTPKAPAPRSATKVNRTTLYNKTQAVILEESRIEEEEEMDNPEEISKGKKRPVLDFEGIDLEENVEEKSRRVENGNENSEVEEEETEAEIVRKVRSRVGRSRLSLGRSQAQENVAKSPRKADEGSADRIALDESEIDLFGEEDVAQNRSSANDEGENSESSKLGEEGEEEVAPSLTKESRTKRKEPVAETPANTASVTRGRKRQSPKKNTPGSAVEETPCAVPRAKKGHYNVDDQTESPEPATKARKNHTDEDTESSKLSEEGEEVSPSLTKESRTKRKEPITEKPANTASVRRGRKRQSPNKNTPGSAVEETLRAVPRAKKGHYNVDDQTESPEPATKARKNQMDEDSPVSTSKRARSQLASDVSDQETQSPTRTTNGKGQETRNTVAESSARNVRRANRKVDVPRTVPSADNGQYEQAESPVPSTKGRKNKKSENSPISTSKSARSQSDSPVSDEESPTKATRNKDKVTESSTRTVRRTRKEPPPRTTAPSANKGQCKVDILVKTPIPAIRGRKNQINEDISASPTKRARPQLASSVSDQETPSPTRTTKGKGKVAESSARNVRWANRKDAPPRTAPSADREEDKVDILAEPPIASRRGRKNQKVEDPIVSPSKRARQQLASPVSDHETPSPTRASKGLGKETRDNVAESTTRNVRGINRKDTSTPKSASPINRKGDGQDGLEITPSPGKSTRRKKVTSTAGREASESEDKVNSPVLNKGKSSRGLKSSRTKRGVVSESEDDKEIEEASSQSDSETEVFITPRTRIELETPALHPAKTRGKSASSFKKKGESQDKLKNSPSPVKTSRKKITAKRREVSESEDEEVEENSSQSDSENEVFITPQNERYAETRPPRTANTRGKSIRKEIQPGTSRTRAATESAVRPTSTRKAAAASRDFVKNVISPKSRTTSSGAKVSDQPKRAATRTSSRQAK